MGLGPRSVEGLHLRWRDVAEGLVEAVVVEPADVLDDGERELRAAAPDAVGDELGVEAVDEALGERVDASLSVPMLSVKPVVWRRVGVVGGWGGVRADAQPYLGPRSGVAPERRHDG
jgi:hypothetical protein